MAGLKDVATVTVEASWSTDPDDTPTWVGITPVEEMSTTPQGRRYELDEVTPTRATIRVDNTSGDYTAGKAISGGYVTTDKRVRVRATLASGGTYTLCDHTTLAAPTTLDSGGFDYASAHLETIDYLDALGTRILRSSYFEHTLLESPTALWTLGDAPGSTSVAEFISGTATPVVDAYAPGNATPGSAGFGADSLLPGCADPNTSLALAPHTTSGVSDGGKVIRAGVNGRGTFLTGTAYGFRLTFATTNDVNGQGILLHQANAAGGSDHPVQVIMGTFGTMAIWMPGWGAPYVPAGTYNDGEEHTLQVLATASNTRIYMDGVLLDSEAAPSEPLTTSGYCTIGGKIVTENGQIDSPYTGRIGFVAFFDSTYVSGSASKTVHYLAAQGFPGETADERVYRVINDWVGYPGTVNGSTGATSLGPQRCAGQSAAAECLKAARDEDGVFFIASDGSPTIRPRSDRYAHEPLVILNQSGQPQPRGFAAATFGGFIGRPNDLPVDTAGLVFEHDRQLLVNDFEATYPDGPTLRFSDAASIAAHRTRNPGSGAVEFSVSSVAELTQAAAWYLFRYAEPRTRVGSIRLRPMTAPALAYWACVLKPLDRIRVGDLPTHAPSPAMDFIIESSRIVKLSNDDWTLELSLSPWIPVLVLDDPVYGALDSYPVGY